MDSAQAKRVLLLYRPGTMDALDPQMSEALQAVQNDPELAIWFENHCSVYIGIRGKLKQIEVPPGLKRSILLENVGRRRRVIPFPAPRVWLSAAAALALLAAGFWTILAGRSGDSFPLFRSVEVKRVQRPYAMSLTTNNQAEVQAYLRAKNVIADYTLPAGLQKLPVEGCADFHWHNKPVSMICFTNGVNPNGKSKEIYLFVAKAADLRDAPPPGGKPRFEQVLNLESASWTTGDKVYILAAPGTESDLQSYLE